MIILARNARTSLTEFDTLLLADLVHKTARFCDSVTRVGQIRNKHKNLVGLHHKPGWEQSWHSVVALWILAECVPARGQQTHKPPLRSEHQPRLPMFVFPTGKQTRLVHSWPLRRSIIPRWIIFFPSLPLPLPATRCGPQFGGRRGAAPTHTCGSGRVGMGRYTRSPASYTCSAITFSFSRRGNGRRAVPQIPRWCSGSPGGCHVGFLSEQEFRTPAREVPSFISPGSGVPLSSISIMPVLPRADGD